MRSLSAAAVAVPPIDFLHRRRRRRRRGAAAAVSVAFRDAGPWPRNLNEREADREGTTRSVEKKDTPYKSQILGSMNSEYEFQPLSTEGEAIQSNMRKTTNTILGRS